ncbi:MAG: zinc metalloprotease HtpX [Candidatus Marsarchaeota archaeon]|nr:zinc metalloprotease HtpX [Candidatus Marsarchaeota archaeon]MCL5105816.1 zinc metalloprotease HtpX [Candidatus Marsarchaeota archaeon]
MSFDLTIKMYFTLFLMFAIGFGIIYFILLFFGFSFSYILVFAVLFFIAQWAISPEIIKFSSHLEYVKNTEYPELHEIVRDLAKEANVPVPRIAISPSQDPNAFVFGRTRKSATLVVHKGLLSILDKNELSGVIAHELGHLKHNDMMVITFISFIPMLAYLIAQNLFFSSMFGGGNNRSSNVDYLVIFGIIAFLVYLIAQLLMLSLSRSRESYADEFSAKTTKKPANLASALFKISYHNINNTNKQSTSMQSFYIIDFFNVQRDMKEIKEHYKEIKGMIPAADFSMIFSEISKQKNSFWGVLNSLYSTHPPTYRRILDMAKIKQQMH